MSTHRDDPNDESGSIDCRYYGRVGPDETSRSAETLQSARQRRSPHTETSNTSSNWYGRSTLSVSGLALLTVTKLLDALTTGIGLLYFSNVYEANPLVAFLFHETGVALGLMVASFIIVVTITLVVEVSSILTSVRRQDGHLAPVVRFVGYGIPSALFAIVSVHNASVLLSGFQMGGVLPF